MRLLVLFCVILLCNSLLAQSDSVLFNKDFKFKDGIYTQNIEFIRNSPKYRKDEIEVKGDVRSGKVKFYLREESSKNYPLQDSIFAYVEQGNLFFCYENRFYRPILKGPISTFYIEKVKTVQAPNLSNNQTVPMRTQYKDDKLFFVDILTGKIDRLTPNNIDYVIKRDNQLYLKFSEVSNSKKNKTLYSYVLKYNQDNPLYINTNY
jgi:hypothetical protein